MEEHNLSGARASLSEGKNPDNVRSLSTQPSVVAPEEAAAESPPSTPDPKRMPRSESGLLPVADKTPTEPWLNDATRRDFARRMSTPSSGSALAVRPPHKLQSYSLVRQVARARPKRKFSVSLEGPQDSSRRVVARTGPRFASEAVYDLEDIPGLSDDDDSEVEEADFPVFPSLRTPRSAAFTSTLSPHVALFPQHSSHKLLSTHPTPQTDHLNRVNPGSGLGTEMAYILGRPQVPVDKPHKFAVFLVHLKTNGTSNAGEGLDKPTLSYLPLVPVKEGITGQVPTLGPATGYRCRTNTPLQCHSKVTWPPEALPTELFLKTIQHLSRDDVENMRLVNKEFERKVSAALFHTSVVPFNTELYDMIDAEVTSAPHSGTDPNVLIYEGKGKQKAVEGQRYVADPSRYKWQELKEDKEGKIYHGQGLRVFKGFGHHMKRFGMSFELSEGQLIDPDTKKNPYLHDSYHGSYYWPPAHYTRFDHAAALEASAEQFHRMTAAFANLTNVDELALSVDSCLGWMAGPDVSVHHQIFKKDSPIFGPSWKAAQSVQSEQEEFWAAFRDMAALKYPKCDPKETTLVICPCKTTKQDLDPPNPVGAENFWSDIKIDILHPELQHRLLSTGLDTVLLYPSRSTSARWNDSLTLSPAKLRKAQKEWILEIAWAQRAFLGTYMLAVIGNQSIFGKNVTKLNIATLSSDFVPLLTRPDFWLSLGSLKELVLLVKPDHRTALKDAAGRVRLAYRHPSNAMEPVNELAEVIAQMENIKVLSIGWAAGGEHEPGVLGRNRFLLPAPITTRAESLAESCEGVVNFPYITHLTLVNCWVTPTTLIYFALSHSHNALLEELTLDSVSLVAPPSQETAVIFAGSIQTIQQEENDREILKDQTSSKQLRDEYDLNGQIAGLSLRGFPRANRPSIWQSPVSFTSGYATAMGYAMHSMSPLPPPPSTAYWSECHRRGSWPNVLNILSPGPHLTDYVPGPEIREREVTPPHPERPFHTLVLKSCGYARLMVQEPYANIYNQSMFDPAHCEIPAPWFRNRFDALAPFMLDDKDLYTAQIVQLMPKRELFAVRGAWGLREGWEDAKKAEEPTYDGRPPGGSGRISGIITWDMPLIVDQFADEFADD